MKQTRILLLAAFVGALTLAADKASAYPLYLKSLSGSICSTADYGESAATTSNKAVTVSVNLKAVMTVVSNQVFLNTGVSVPVDARIAFDPNHDATYLTNSTGYYRDLEEPYIARIRIHDIATSFKASSRGGLSEGDKSLMSLDVQGYGPDEEYFEFQVTGAGRLDFKVDGRTGGSNMSLSLRNGSDQGTFQSGDDGVCKGGFTLKGSGVPEWSGPYSVFWFND